MANLNYKLLLNKSMLNDFSIDGGWISMDDNVDLSADEGKLKYGTLEYKDGSSKLKLFQSWKEKLDRINSDTSLIRKSNILGVIAEDNSKFVLIPSIARTADTDDLKYFSNNFSVVKRAWDLKEFSVINYDPKDRIDFTNIILDYSHLNEWIDPAQRFITNSKNMSLKIKNSKSILLSRFTYHGQLFLVKLAGNIIESFGDWNRTIKYVNKSYLVIEGENNISTNLAKYFAQEFRKMLAVIYGAPENTTRLSMQGFNKTNKYLALQDIYFLEMRSVNKKSKLNIGYKFTFKNDIQMEQLIPNWFNADEELKLLIQDYLLTVNYRTSVENELINLTEGIESFYRNKKKVYLIDKLKWFLATFSDEIKNNLTYYVGNLDSWAYSLKQTRAHIAHGDQKKAAIKDFETLSKHVGVLKVLVQAFILQQLGNKLSSDKIESNIALEFNSEFI